MKNKLLLRQIHKHVGKNWEQQIPQELHPLLEAIANTYDHHKTDRTLLERAMEISSEELMEANSKLRSEAERQQILIHKLKKSLVALRILNVPTDAEQMNDEDVIALADYLADQIQLRTEAEERLLESQVRLTTLIENTTDIIWSVDTQFVITSCNKAFKQAFSSGLYQYPAEGMSPEDYLSHNEQYYWLKLYRRALVGNHFREDFQKKTDAGEVYYELSFSPIIVHNTITGVSVFGRDITERKHVEAALYKRDRLLEGLAEANELLLTADIDEALPQALTTLGMSAGADKIVLFENDTEAQSGVLSAHRRFMWEAPALASGSSIVSEFQIDESFPHWLAELHGGEAVLVYAEFAPEPERSFLQAQGISSIFITPVIAEEQAWGYIGYVYNESGHTWYEHDESVLMTAAGSIAGAIAHAQSKKALQRSEERYRSVVNSVQEVIFQTDKDLRLVFLNPAWQQLLEYSPTESLGTLFTNYICPADRNALGDYCKPLFDREKMFCRHEIRFRTKHGATRWMDVYASLTLDEEGNIAGISGTISDITERKNAEQELELALRKERDLNVLKTRFVGTVSHEFRTPLTGIMMSIELLEGYIDRMDARQRQKEISSIRERVGELTRLMDDILLQSSVESIVELFRPEPVDVQALCHSVVDDLSSIAQQADHTIELSIGTEVQCLNADRKLMRHVLRNLLSNAIKYSPAGSTVLFNVYDKYGQVHFEVTDSGIGIPEEDIPRLFIPFFRASNTGAIKGTGLGLSIVKEFVEVHGGEIIIDTKVGYGTTFIVRLPPGTEVTSDSQYSALTG